MYQGYGARICGGGRRLRRRKPGPPGAHLLKRPDGCPGPHSPLPWTDMTASGQVLPGAGRYRPGAHGQLYSPFRTFAGTGLVRLPSPPVRRFGLSPPSSRREEAASCCSTHPAGPAGAGRGAAGWRCGRISGMYSRCSMKRPPRPWRASGVSFWRHYKKQVFWQF